MEHLFAWLVFAQISPAPLPHVDDASFIANILPIVFGLAGALSVLFICYGGFKYVTSQGEPDKIQKAKDTVMYSVIGLVVSISAYAIVAFVTSKV